MNQPLHVERRAHGLELTLNRPERRNALSCELIVALRATLRAAVSDESLRSVLITGAPPAFCAGLDLHEVADSGRAADEHDTTALLELYELLDALPKPVIAAVNGPAVAGGAGLVCVCDLVLCGRSARIGYPGIRHGLVAPIVMPYLLRLVGQRRATYLLLTGNMLSAAQAVAAGLANESVADHELMGRAREYADRLASHSPSAVAETKSLLARLRNLHGAELLAEARRLSAAVPLTDNARTGLRRFLAP
jgi:methylglutaconyl-CoA hydratase